jgi:hypothetical protein
MTLAERNVDSQRREDRGNWELADAIITLVIQALQLTKNAKLMTVVQILTLLCGDIITAI